MIHNFGDPSLDRIESLGVFADWRLPKDEDLLFVGETLRGAHSGWNRIILGIWPRNTVPGWKPRYKPETVRDRLEACRDVGLDPVVMAWAKRDELAIREMCEWLKAATYHDTPVLLDAEGAWHRGSRDFDAQEAAYVVTGQLKGTRWGVTGLGNLQHSVALLADQSHFVVPQCYSFWRPRKRQHWSHSRQTFPGPQQKYGIRSWGATGIVDAEIIMGLGCYWAARPAQGLTPALTATQVMRMSVAETVALGVKSVWWWSLKWLRKRNRRGEEVRRFFGLSE
jgi:hypothetical protein